jgi:hypothetical protein
MSYAVGEVRKPGQAGLGKMARAKHEMLDADKGVGWLRKRRAALLKKKAQYEKNRAARSAFYSEWQGQTRWQVAGGWHTTLNGLSAGTNG